MLFLVSELASVESAIFIKSVGVAHSYPWVFSWTPDIKHSNVCASDERKSNPFSNFFVLSSTSFNKSESSEHCRLRSGSSFQVKSMLVTGLLVSLL